MEPVAISITEAAKALGIGRTSTYQLIHEQKLATIRIGRRQLVTTASIRQLAEGASEAEPTNRAKIDGACHE